MSQLGGEYESRLSTLMGGRCVPTPNTLRNFREQETALEAHLTMRLRQGGCCTKLPPESETATVESPWKRSISIRVYIYEHEPGRVSCGFHFCGWYWSRYKLFVTIISRTVVLWYFLNYIYVENNGNIEIRINCRKVARIFLEISIIMIIKSKLRQLDIN